jgi:hypothetical protein
MYFSCYLHISKNDLLKSMPHLFLRVVRDLNGGTRTDWIRLTREWVSRQDSLLFVESGVDTQ